MLSKEDVTTTAAPPAENIRLKVDIQIYTQDEQGLTPIRTSKHCVTGDDALKLMFAIQHSFPS